MTTDSPLTSLALVYDVTPESGGFELSPEIRFDELTALKLIHDQMPIGLWRADFETGHLYLSAETYRIYGLEPQDGPANIVALNRAIHPDDHDMAMSLIETAARQKCGFQYVLRLEDGKGGYKYVRSVGRYIERADGAGELSGIFHEIPE